MDVVLAEDGVARCGWAATTPDYFAYHDSEWGFGATDERRLFEKLCLEGFQSGLSWITILRKRENFRAAFDGFDVAKVAGYGEADIERLLSDAGIVRHGGKIRSAVNNARRTLELYEQFGSLAEFFWRFADLSDTPPVELPAVTETSTAISKELKRLGFTFVGPTTMYAHMQAMGLVNDHLAGCPARPEAQRARVAAAARVGATS
jgi:DNA-3-methyladenine glycosylase I